MSLKSWAKQYAKKHGFEFKELSFYQCRVKNGSKYVDFWENGSFRTIEGEFMTASQTNSGINMISDVNDCWNIKEEIKKLVL